ncbi:hypothetical protein WJX77_007806 [Trebouxia sp. C0004]
MASHPQMRAGTVNTEAEMEEGAAVPFPAAAEEANADLPQAQQLAAELQPGSGDMSPGQSDEVPFASDAGSVPLAPSHEQTERLKGMAWLNDEVINGIIELLNARAQELDALDTAIVPKTLILNTFFYAKLSE